MGTERGADDGKRGRTAISLTLAAVLFTGLTSLSAAQDGPVTPDLPTRVEVAGAALLPDGTLALPDGSELVLGGLDVGMGLVPATKAYLREVRALLDGSGPWRLTRVLRDRYNRLTGRVETADGVWVQERLLRLGLARFSGGIADKDERHALLAAERSARAARHGVWRNPRYIVRPADDPDAIYNGFQIVEGPVVAVGRGDGVVFLNFGEDRHEDFTAGVTVRLRPGDLGAIENGEALSVYDLEGRTVRLRGTVRRYNGPFMEIADADQIELLPVAGRDPIMHRSTSPSDRRPASGSTL